MHNTVIGLVGVKESGKSTTVNIIKEFIPESEESALANKLKNTCAKFFNLERNQFDDQNLKEKIFKTPKILDKYTAASILEEYDIYMELREIDALFDVINMELNSPRHIAQIVGTQLLRKIDSDIHCKTVKLSNVTVISDVRFVNEYDFFSKNKGISFLPLYINNKKAESKVAEDSHQSEREVREFANKCIEVDNNGTISDLERNIKKALDVHFFKTLNL